MTQAVLGRAAARAALAAFNHLVRQQSWVRDRLRAHGGRGICLVLDLPWGAAQARATIDAEGFLQPAEEGADAAVTLTLQPRLDTLFSALREGPQALAGGLKLEGDVLLAAALGELAQHLRWDVEEDLSRWVGDQAAHQAGQLARRVVAAQTEARERVISGVRAWCVEEAQLLLDRQTVSDWRATVRDLEQRLARLELKAH